MSLYVHPVGCPEHADHVAEDKIHKLFLRVNELYPEHAQEIQALTQELLSHYPNDIDYLVDVIGFAATNQTHLKHKDVPEIIHELRVASRLATTGHVQDKYLLAAAIVHHGHFDPHYTHGNEYFSPQDLDKVEHHLGRQVRELVKEFDSLPEFKGEGREEVIKGAPKLSPAVQDLWLGGRLEGLHNRSTISQKDAFDAKRFLDALKDGNHCLRAACYARLAALPTT